MLGKGWPLIYVAVTPLKSTWLISTSKELLITDILEVRGGAVVVVVVVLVVVVVGFEALQV